MNNSNNKTFNTDIEYEQKKRKYHFKLGANQLKQKPFLLLMLVPVILAFLLTWKYIEDEIVIWDMPLFFLNVIKISFVILGMLIPVLLIWCFVEIIGSHAAMRDELRMKKAYTTDELRNGSPILLYRSSGKKNGVLERRWYSPIAMETWKRREDAIQDQFAEHFVKKLDYLEGADCNIVVMLTAKGRKMKDRGDIIDGQF